MFTVVDYRLADETSCLCMSGAIMGKDADSESDSLKDSFEIRIRCH